MTETQRTILVVEDSPTELTIVQDCLRSAGYRVLPALDGAAARDQAQREVIDLIVLDLILPDMNGYDLYRFFQTNQRTQATPVVMLTRRISQPEEIYGKMLGAAAYLKKPLQPDLLLSEAQRLAPRWSDGSAPSFDGPARSHDA